MKLDVTLVAARILGPLFVFAGVLLITNPIRVMNSIDGFVAISQDHVMTLAGFVVLIMGLTLVTFHQRWDSVTAGIITIIGWLFVVRGGVMLLAPQLIKRAADFLSTEPQALPIAGCAAALLGVWLTYTGYIAGMLRFDHPTR